VITAPAPPPASPPLPDPPLTAPVAKESMITPLPQQLFSWPTSPPAVDPAPPLTAPVA